MEGQNVYLYVTFVKTRPLLLLPVNTIVKLEHALRLANGQYKTQNYINHLKY